VDRQEIAGAWMGKYEILEELGRGGMGIVYLAFDPDLKRKVALKILNKGMADDAGFVRRFEEEARAVADLFHPNILPINSLSREGERLVIEMPYIETGSLADIIGDQGLHFPEVVVYCADILDALAACHAHGIVHRDVKPGNILIHAQGRALLSDFGLAKALDVQPSAATDGVTATSVFVGTPRYAPLEAWDGAAPSPGWDLFSVGVILYEGLSGTRLVESDTFLGYVRAMERGSFPRLAEVRQGISEPMSDLVEGLLARSTAERPSDAESVLRALRSTPEYERCRDSGEVTGVRPVPRRVRGVFRRRYRSYGLLALFAAVVLLLAGALVLALGGYVDLPEFSGGVAGVESEREAVAVAGGILGLSRFVPPERGLAFTALVAGAPDRRERFVLVENSESRKIKGLLFSDLRLCELSFDRQDEEETFGIAGKWGAFTDASALECLRGEVEGTARWLMGESALGMTLAFSGPDYALQWEEHITLIEQDETDTATLWGAEGSEYVAPLLIRELAVRDRLWFDVLRYWLPALPDAHLVLKESPAGADASEMDAAWKESLAEAIPGFPRNGGSNLAGLIRDNRVVLRLWAPEELAEGWKLRLAVQTGYAVPQRDSTRYEATYDGGAWVNGKIFEHGRETAWRPSWQLEHPDGEVGWPVELLMDELPPPTLLSPWRVNVMVLPGAGDGPEQAILFWGAPDPSQVRHGVMLFGPER